MEITTVVLRGSLTGGSLAWSRKSVSRNFCRALSAGDQKSKVQRHPSLFAGAVSIQSFGWEGVTMELGVLRRSVGLGSLRCQHLSQRVYDSQELSSALHVGNKGRFAMPRASLVFLRRNAAGITKRFQSFCNGPVLLSLASRFHTVSVREGRYICLSDGGNGYAEGLSVDCPNRCTEKDEEQDDILNEFAHVATSRISANIEPQDADESRIDHWVVNFYHFVRIDDPHLLVARHTEFLKNHDVRGRIYISEQGINTQLSSRGTAAFDYADWVKKDPRFSDLLVQTSPSPEGHAFPRLRLRYKPSLVQVEGGTQDLPVTDPTARAVPLSPAEWTKRLDEAKLIRRTKNVESHEDSDSDHEHLDDGNLSSTSSRQVVLLDVRNGYEWDVGHFKGAPRPNVDCFKSTAFGLAEETVVVLPHVNLIMSYSIAIVSLVDPEVFIFEFLQDVNDDPLGDVDKEKVDVMMYCTGGIRCDVYSTILRSKGFKNLFSLKGGVSNYLKEEDAKKWAGNLFVFDSRLAIPPDVYHSKSTQEGGLSEGTLFEKFVDSSTEEGFARCRLCGDPLSNPRHRNCASLDCNQLYLSCDKCLPQYKGCCSHACSSAGKLRPLISSQQYERWHKYRPTETAPPKPADYISRRAMKRRRRKERRKQLMTGGASEEQKSEQFVEIV